jgi:lysophospholipase L1-like esterase
VDVDATSAWTPEFQRSLDLTERAPAIRAGTGKVVAVLGDSRAEGGHGFGSLPDTVYNFGAGGTTSRAIVHQLPGVLDVHPDVVFIFGGVNDFGFIDLPGFRANLQQVAAQLSGQGARVYVLPQLVAPKAGNPYLAAGQYAEALQGIPSTVYLPVAGLSATDFRDNVHLNSAGYAKVELAMLSVLKE